MKSPEQIHLFCNEFIFFKRVVPVSIRAKRMSLNHERDSKRIRYAREDLDHLVDPHADADLDDDDDDDGALAGADEEDAAAGAHASVASRLQERLLISKSRLVRPVALALKAIFEQNGPDPQRSFPAAVFRRGHALSATCVAVSSDGRTAFTGSKDCSVLRWDLSSIVEMGSARFAAGVEVDNVSPAYPRVSFRYPGRRRTKDDVARQAQLAVDFASGKTGVSAVIPVTGSGHGGGRLELYRPEVSLTDSSAKSAERVRSSLGGSLDISRARILPASSGGGSTIVAQSLAPPSAATVLSSHLRGLPNYGIDGHFDEVLCISLSHDGESL